MLISEHSKVRGKERLGLDKKAFEHLAEKAFIKGYNEKCFKKSGVKDYLAYLYLSQPQDSKCGGIRIYGEFVYIFTKKGMLKTVLHLPKEFKKYKNYLLNEKNTPEEKSKTSQENIYEEVL